MHSYGRMVAVLGGFLLSMPVLAGAEQMPQVKEQVGVIDDTGAGLGKIEQQNGISYMSGGAGSDEAKAFNGVKDGFNLKLTTSVSNGAYTSASSIRITDTAGNQVLDVRPNGPIFLAKLPNGDYVVHATAEGRTMTRKVSVSNAGMEAIALTWPATEPEPHRFGDAPEEAPEVK